LNILIAGGAGYIGSILIDQLLKKGYKVKCLDKFFFGEESVIEAKDQIEVIKDDIRTFDSSILKDVDVVVNLVAISQPDPTQQITPNLFYEINHQGCTRLARLSKKEGVKKYIFTSTCSVYGFQEGLITEETAPNPLEAYGESKLLAERDAVPLAGDDFSVTILRLATLYGLSPR